MSRAFVPERGFQHKEHDSAQDHEAAHDDPEEHSALLAFALLECIAAMAAFPRGTVMGSLVDEIPELGQDLFGVDPDEPGI